MMRPPLVPVQENEAVKTQEIEVKSLDTRPPAKYTEATLLSAMEGAGKLIEDEELARRDGRERARHTGHTPRRRLKVCFPRNICAAKDARLPPRPRPGR